VEVMSPLDSAFLRLEDRHTSLHIASIAVFDGPPPTYDEIAAMFMAKLPMLPRYRQRVREIPFQLGRPVWVDDPQFSLSNHLRHTALPRPGAPEQLNELVGRLMSQQLDRDRSLWDTWIVEGLADGRWALINRVHHCMVDGIAGTDLLSTVLDHSAEPSVPIGDTVRATVEPSRLRLLASAATSLPRHPGDGLGHAYAGLRHPRATATAALTRLHGMLGFVGLARPAAASSLSGSIGSARCWASARVSLDDVSVIRHSLGGTVNDVVLAAVTSGFRNLLLSRHEPPVKHAVRTLVPVSVRTSAQRGQTDNQVSAIVTELPVHLADPVARLHAVRAELDRLKQSGEAQAGAIVTEFAKYIPPVLLSAGLTGIFHVPQRSIVTVATNVPGPRIPLYAAGRRLRELYPYVPIADQLRIGVAISSYAGALYFGVTADLDSTPDLGVLVAGIEDGLRDLVKAAEQVVP
jgi:WS/DGAT/MGAT family acyltransferase